MFFFPLSAQQRIPKPNGAQAKLFLFYIYSLSSAHARVCVGAPLFKREGCTPKPIGRENMRINWYR